MRSNRKTAVKVFDRAENFAKELECYRRLRRSGVVKMGIFAIPELVDCDDEFLVVEMSIVSPPYLIDFGKAYLDNPPDYPSDAMAHWRQSGIELFGDKWSTVLTALASLRQYGIYYVDAKPANICFADDADATD